MAANNSSNNNQNYTANNNGQQPKSRPMVRDNRSPRIFRTPREVNSVTLEELRTDSASWTAYIRGLRDGIMRMERLWKQSIQTSRSRNTQMPAPPRPVATQKKPETRKIYFIPSTLQGPQPQPTPPQPPRPQQPNPTTGPNGTTGWKPTTRQAPYTVTTGPRPTGMLLHNGGMSAPSTSLKITKKKPARMRSSHQYVCNAITSELVTPFDEPANQLPPAAQLETDQESESPEDFTYYIHGENGETVKLEGLPNGMFKIN